ncbi:MAG: sensor histidine kinase [Mycobacteriales bacterium]
MRLRVPWSDTWSDAGLAALTAQVNIALVQSSTEARVVHNGLLSSLAAAAMAVPVLYRRRWPLGVLLACSVLLFAYYTAGFPGISPAGPLAVPLYTAAVAGRLRWALGVVVFYISAGVFFRLLRHDQPGPMLAAMLQIGAAMVFLVLLGDTVRSRRERLAQAAQEQEREAERRVAEERLRIARDLHDVLAHTIAVITVQAGVAADGLAPDDPGRPALEAIRAASKEALVELRATVGLVRTGENGTGPPPPAPGLAQLGTLVEAARGTGLRVESAVEGTPRPLPAAVELTAYRIVQESLTNVVRHADASTATVTVRYGGDGITVEVRDDGHGPDGGGQGFGLVGMAERAAAVGGRLTAAPAGGRGFHVSAWLPEAAV